ncbi:MAG: MEDS domain-containing protein, partial [bacterium]
GTRFLSGLKADESALQILDPSRSSLDADSSPATYSTAHVHVDGGFFDPARMRGFWRTRSQEATGRGFRHLRAVAEMAWALQGLPGTEQAEVFESSLNPALSGLPISVICQYGSVRFPPNVLLAMLLNHPMVVIGERVFSNPFYVEHDKFPARLEEVGTDPIGALVPIWRHFLHRLPTTRELASFLCNSLPTLMPSTSVFIRIDGLECHFDTARETLTENGDAVAPPGVFSRLYALWAGSHELLGGAVHVGIEGPQTVLDATYEGRETRLTLVRTGSFSPAELLRFTGIASAIGGALAALPKTPVSSSEVSQSAVSP